MFEKLFRDIHKSESKKNQSLKNDISRHRETFVKEMQQHFGELSGDEAAVIRNPFSANNAIENVPDELQGKFFKLQNNSIARDLLSEKSLMRFWCAMQLSHPNQTMLAFCSQLPFFSTHLKETGFPTLVCNKTKSKKRLDIENHLRLLFTNTSENFKTCYADASSVFLLAYLMFVLHNKVNTQIGQVKC